VGTLALFLFFFFGCCVFFWSPLAHPDELGVPLELESDKVPDSKLCFEACGNLVCILVCRELAFAAASPTRLFVFRPGSIPQVLCEIAVGVGSVLAIVSNVDGVEVVLQEVAGHCAIVMMPHPSHIYYWLLVQRQLTRLKKGAEGVVDAINTVVERSSEDRRGVREMMRSVDVIIGLILK
jgi:hypothetical protein